MPAAAQQCIHTHARASLVTRAGKRIDNTSVRDEPYKFVLGGEQVRSAAPAWFWPKACDACTLASRSIL